MKFYLLLFIGAVSMNLSLYGMERRENKRELTEEEQIRKEEEYLSGERFGLTQAGEQKLIALGIKPKRFYRPGTAEAEQITALVPASMIEHDVVAVLRPRSSHHHQEEPQEDCRLIWGGSVTGVGGVLLLPHNPWLGVSIMISSLVCCIYGCGCCDKN